MATVEELLAGSSVASSYPDANDIIHINPVTRQLLVPGTEIILGVETDEKAERKYFKCPKVVGADVDVCACSIRIFYKNAFGEKDYSVVDDIADDGEDVLFSWLLPRKATKYRGETQFSICLCTTADGVITVEWNTTPAVGKVLEGLEVVNHEDDEPLVDDIAALQELVRQASSDAARAETAAQRAEAAASSVGGAVGQANEALNKANEALRVANASSASAAGANATANNASTLASETADRVTTLEQEIADLKYEAIEILSWTNDVGTVELGSRVTKVSASWKLNKMPTQLSVDGREAATMQTAGTHIEMYSDDKAITSDKSLVLNVTDERSATDTATTKITFLNGVYYGALEDDATIDSAAVLTLTRKLQAGKAITFTADAGASQKIAYALPTSYGTPNFNVGGFDGGFYKAATIDFTNASGYTESYDVWLSENVDLGSTTVKVT